jgi:large subunit ribosomal protein L25
VAENVLAAEGRTDTGKGAARRLRAAGRIPAVLYGPKADSRSITVEARALQLLFQKSAAGINTLIDLTLDGGKEVVIVKELQREPVRGTYLHADFYTVDLAQKIEVSVPVHLVGKAPGVELGGGILDHPLREIELSCLPRAIPEQIEVDVSALQLGESIHVGELSLPEGVEVLSDPELAVASVVAPRVEEEPTEEAAAAAEVAEAPAAEAEPESSEGGD